MLKLDFYKAFDSVSWSFLLKTLRCRGFPHNYLCWLELLFNSSCSALLVNGLVGPTFKHRRGLRQGDPISPSLFLLAADVLTRMMQVTSLTISERLSPELNDPFYILQYADDTLIFSTAKRQAPRSLLLVLELFSKVSGMTLNLVKSSFVPFSLQEQQVELLQNLFCCSSTTLPIQYLGLPLSYKRPDRATFQMLIDKLTKRLSGWKAKMLSRAGRLVLASSVLSTIPVFFMSVFKLPVWVVRAIDRLRRDFIWKGPAQQNRGVNLLSWDRVCLPKSLGGFGLLNLTLHNISLLLRWLWRIYDKPQSQWASIAKLLYSAVGRLNTPLVWKQSGSFFWRDLRNLRPFFQLSVKAEVHRGDGTLFWYDNWAGTLVRFIGADHPFPNRYITLRDALPRLDHLLPSPMNFLETQIYDAAQNFHLSTGADKFLWRWRTDGRFSVSSVYKHLASAGKCSFVFKNLWKLRVPPTIHMFLVLLAHGRILTQDQLLRRGIPCQHKCVMCGMLIIEDREHLFCECIFAQNIWTRMQFNAPTVNIILHNLCSANTQWQVNLATALWGLWLERNNRTFREEIRPLDLVHQWIVQQATLFWKFC
ncbi:RNA-directed DNA polymerase (reverse transcriptase)-related family protein [Rhynchospora pubera]|uniref:RNA-directed DNA polymerase (Reverse transcriptase)-related family protein n=1 Tax=Rhynchospora pubera TaxID=906938 RepID=A0AAV8ELU5_9POAL|nr:RNA-directed DNA polymerase (reverse transcriptase)-related family protein [Rhynchospora pubera]